MSEPNRKNAHWLPKFAIIGGSAIISAIVAGYLGTYILVLFWGEVDVASMGVIAGPPIGFLMGIGTSIRYLKKQMPAFKTIGISALVAVLVTSLVFAVFGLIGWIALSLNL